MRAQVKIYLFFTFIGIFVYFYSKGTSLLSSTQVDAPQVVTEVQAQTFEPSTIEIPSVSVLATVEVRGLDSEGKMGVPDENTIVSWWKYGPKFGEVGNGVVAGHFKQDDGSAGVFYNLNKVKIGETITLTDETGQKFIYRITQRTLFTVADFPTMEIYGKSNQRNLYLITCAGKYKDGDYTQRLVIKAVLL